MYKLIYFHSSNKHNIEAETFNVILEHCFNVWETNGEPLQIFEDDKLIYEHCQIYELMHKCYY